MFLALFQQLHKRLVVCCLSLRFDLHLTHLTSTCCTRFYVSVIVYVYPCVSMCIGSQRGIRGIGQSYHYAKCKHANSLFICLNYVFSCTFCILFFAYWFVCVILCYSVFHCLVRSTYYQATLSNWQRTALKTSETFGSIRPHPGMPSEFWSDSVLVSRDHFVTMKIVSTRVQPQKTTERSGVVFLI